MRNPISFPCASDDGAAISLRVPVALIVRIIYSSLAILSFIYHPPPLYHYIFPGFIISIWPRPSSSPDCAHNIFTHLRTHLVDEHLYLSLVLRVSCTLSPKLLFVHATLNMSSSCTYNSMCTPRSLSMACIRTTSCCS